MGSRIQITQISFEPKKSSIKFATKIIFILETHFAPSGDLLGPRGYTWTKLGN